MIQRLAALLCLVFLSIPTQAQRAGSVLSDAEIEQLRESAYVPNDRVLLFIKLLDARDKSIQTLYAHPRRPGREEDTHDLLEQFTAIADELSDNLDDFGPHHRDLRKSLPKLLNAAERWASDLKSPPPNDAYNVARTLALESIRDLRESAAQLVEQQKAWFAAHPPPKDDSSGTKEAIPPGPSPR